MNIYRVKKVNISKVKNTDEYWDAVNHASVHYIEGVNALREFCGGRLHRERNGYAGINGNIEYVAEICGRM